MGKDSKSLKKRVRGFNAKYSGLNNAKRIVKKARRIISRKIFRKGRGRRFRGSRRRVV